MTALSKVKSFLNYNTKTFAFIVFGQLVSTFGSRMSSFGMGVWVYQETGSTTQFGLTLFLQMLPTLLTSFFAGIVIDRFSRRAILIFSSIGGALNTIIVALMAFTGDLRVEYVYASILINAIFSSIYNPTFIATVPLLVEKRFLGRANGIISTGNSIGQIIGPALAGVLVATVQLGGLLLVDSITFIVLIGILLLTQIPNPPQSTDPSTDKRKSLFNEAFYGYTYIKEYPGLLALFFFQLIQMFLVQMSLVVYTPMILDLTTADVLGLIVSIGGLGGVAGGVVMSVWGGPRNRMHGVLGSALLIGVGLVLTGIRPFVTLIAIGTTFLLFVSPIQEGSRTALWQTKVAHQVQGRVFAFQQMGISFVVLIAYSTSGLIAERIFAPLLANNGTLANTIVGDILGVGAGRGAALFYVCLGILLIIVTSIAYLYPRLRLLDSAVPDVV